MGIKHINPSAVHASALLDQIKQVDGPGSGLDADTLDGVHASGFMRDAGNSYLNLSSDSFDAWATLPSGLYIFTKSHIPGSDAAPFSDALILQMVHLASALPIIVQIAYSPFSEYAWVRNGWSGAWQKAWKQISGG